MKQKFRDFGGCDSVKKNEIWRFPNGLESMGKKFIMVTFGGCDVLKGMKFKGFQMLLKVWHKYLEVTFGASSSVESRICKF